MLGMNKLSKQNRFDSTRLTLKRHYCYHSYRHYYYFVIIVIIEPTHSKTILENTVKIEKQPAALDFKNFSQYSVVPCKTVS